MLEGIINHPFIFNFFGRALPFLIVCVSFLGCISYLLLSQGYHWFLINQLKERGNNE